MIKRWLRHILWRPFELSCRRYPLVPLRATVTEPVKGVTCIRIDNLVTRLLSRFGGGYDRRACSADPDHATSVLVGMGRILVECSSSDNEPWCSHSAWRLSVS